jgi:uncharacterized protein YjcR
MAAPIDPVKKMQLTKHILELHHKGLYTLEIARTVGVSSVTVLKWLRENGYEPNFKNFNNSKIGMERRKGRFAHLK